MKLQYLFIFSLIVILGSSCTTSREEGKASSEQITIYLVRHAEKMDDGTSDPPLTAIGQKRAQSLATLLAPKKIHEIYSSDYKRTRETAYPLSRKINRPIRTYDPRELAVIAEKVAGFKGKSILIVGHSNSTPTLANLLIKEDKYTQYDESEYSNLITIRINGKNISSEMSSFDIDM